MRKILFSVFLVLLALNSFSLEIQDITFKKTTEPTDYTIYTTKNLTTNIKLFAYAKDFNLKNGASEDWKIEFKKENDLYTYIYITPLKDDISTEIEIFKPVQAKLEIISSQEKAYSNVEWESSTRVENIILIICVVLIVLTISFLLYARWWW